MAASRSRSNLGPLQSIGPIVGGQNMDRPVLFFGTVGKAQGQAARRQQIVQPLRPFDQGNTIGEGLVQTQFQGLFGVL